MKAVERWKLDSAERVRVFNESHPAPDAASEAVFTLLETRLAQARELDARARSGRAAAAAATAERSAIKADLGRGLLRLLVKVGEAAAEELPELVGRFRQRKVKGPNRTFLTEARNMVALARANQETFTRLGMAEPLLDELTATLDRFSRTIERGAEARHQHVAARAELHAVTADVVDLVARIDALNQHRFRGDVETLAAWASATNVFGPMKRRQFPESPPAGGAGQDLAA